MARWTGFSGRTTVVDAYVDYSCEYISNRKCEVTLKLYAARIDWDGNSSTAYTATCNTPSSWSEDYDIDVGTYYFKNKEYLHLCTRTFTVTVDDSGNASVNLYFSVTAKSSSSYSVSGTLTKLDCGAPPVSSYKLSISKGTGTNIVVSRTSSPRGGASIGNLSSGAKIYDQDVLNISVSADVGYDDEKVTVNNSEFTSGSDYIVTGAVSVKSTAIVKSFKLSISADDGSVIEVDRTGSPKANADTGNLTNGATIYYSDVLKISASADVSYEIETLSVNGDAFVSGNLHTVTEAVLVVASTGRLGLAYINDEAYIVLIDEEIEWVQCIPQVDNETDWDICS